MIIHGSSETNCNPKWGYSSVGRAPALHAGCQEFESPYLQKIEHRLSSMFNLFVVLVGQEVICFVSAILT